MRNTTIRDLNPKVLYHFTCRFNLNEILQDMYLNLTESNFSLERMGMFPVVWMTTMDTPDNHGLLFDPNMPDYINKTYIRFTIRWKPHFKQWDKWSDEKGMDKDIKQALIDSASATETYKSWYVSERNFNLLN